MRVLSCFPTIVTSLWFAEQVMADTPLRASSGTEGLRDHDEEKSPVEPPSEESDANVMVCPTLHKRAIPA